MWKEDFGIESDVIYVINILVAVIKNILCLNYFYSLVI